MAGKISEYANAVATFADGDLVDVSKRLSTSPDVFQSQKLEFAQFQAFIQANASNILNTNGLTLTGNYSHNLNGNDLTFINGNINLDGKFSINATDEGILLPRLTTAQKIAISTPETNLIVFDTDLNSLQRYNGSSWVSLSGYGILSLMNSAGEPSFYSSYNSAIASANTGDTITQYSNIEDSSNTIINIDKSLTINLNGFTYTNSSSGTSDCIQISTTGKVKILNGTIKRINGTYGTTQNRALVVTSNGNAELTGTDLINEGGISLYSTGADTNILNGKFITTGQTINQISVESVANITGSVFESSAYNNFNGVIFNVKATSTSTNVLKAGYASFCEFRQTNASGYDAILLNNGSNGVHCKAYNVSTNYPAIRISGANTEINFCYGFSTLDNGIEVGTGTPRGIYNCIGVNASGANKYGGQITSLSDGVYNSTFIGLGGYGAVVNSGSDNIFVKCNFINKNSAVSNGAFYDTSAGTVRVYDCYSEQADSGKPNLRFTNASKVVYLASNKLKGGSVGISIAHASGNSQTTAPDSVGNIVLD
tara:strand:- start:1130 stop:2752 length:1623 start_codon:yes stop_codon:yes gene_type:complete